VPNRSLVHADDTMPGITRHKRGTGFVYRRPDGRRISQADLERIRRLAIPPAWTDVWICPDPRGHLQATGRDARGRKQHRYHATWVAQRDEAKYTRILDFARALPRLRRRVARDLAVPGLSRRKVVAAVVRLLEQTLIRVGNEEYARDNGSYGLTTFLDRHARLSGSEVRFKFRGKSGKAHEVSIDDPKLARVIKKCRDLPGSQLFQFVDENGRVCDIGSGDVNDYLREVTGEGFSAKDFRTWAATVLTAKALDELQHFDSVTQGQRHIQTAIDAVAALLGNTRAVCRRSYVHPEVLGAYLDRTLTKALRRKALGRLQQTKPSLGRTEAAVLALLHRRLGQRPASLTSAAA
jgi:DNA topoisomerase-1